MKRKNKNKNRGGQSASKKRAPRYQGVSHASVSECTERYVAALSDPFSGRSMGACVPRFPALRSQKVAAFSKFTFTTGTGGYGFINVLPVLCNDQPVVHYSDVAFTGFPSAGHGVIGATGTSVAYHNGPYTKTQLSGTGATGCRGRIVAVGLRLTPTCAAGDFGGLITTYVDSDHSNVYDFTGSQILSRPTACNMRARINGHSVNTGGLDDGELEYSTADTIAAGTFEGIYPYSKVAYNGTDTAIGGSPMTVRVSSAKAGIPFYCEIILHMEYIGPLTSAAQTDSHVDPNGFAAANAAMTQVHGATAGKALDPSAQKSYFRTLFNSALKSFTPDAALLGSAAGRVGKRYAAGKIAQLAARTGGLALLG